MNKFLAIVVLTSMLAISGLKAQSERHRVGAECNDDTSAQRSAAVTARITVVFVAGTTATRLAPSREMLIHRCRCYQNKLNTVRQGRIRIARISGQDEEIRVSMSFAAGT